MPSRSSRSRCTERETPGAPIAQSQAVAAIGGDATLIDWLVRRTGLLVRQEQHGATSTRSVIEIAHLQVQEYLAGCALANRIVAATAAEILERWGNESTWVEPLQYAAARLASLDELEILDHWVVNRLAESANATPEPSATLVTASILGRADAEFLPAPDSTRRIITKLATSGGGYYLADTVAALCSLVPRPAALAAAREIALQTPSGLAWLGRTSPLPLTSTSTIEETALAHCCRSVIEHGSADDRQLVVEWVVATGPRLSTMAEWATFAPTVAELHGADAGRRFLESLAGADQWLMDASAGDVVALLDVTEAVGPPGVALELALRGSQGSERQPATAGFVSWLDVRGQGAGLVDRFDDALRELVERSDGDRDWSLDWHALPLWPDRDRPSADALRLAVLRQRHLSWFVMREALADARYREPAGQAWLSIVTSDPDRSRRSSLLHEMIEYGDPSLAGRLLTEALRNEQVCRWSGTRIVPRLTALGYAPQARSQLEAIIVDPATTGDHRDAARELLAQVGRS